MNLKSKLFYFFIVSVFVCQPLYAKTDDMIHVLNPDPYSQAMGASILALSPSVFGFFVNPASNYANFSKELQLSYMSFFDSNYGAGAGVVIPTEKSGNFTVYASGMFFNKQSEYYDYKTYITGALNYVYPLVEADPIYTEKGGIGATIKFYNISLQNDKSMTLYSLDLGAIYNLSFIDRNLTGALAVKNIGNDLDFGYFEYLGDSYTQKQARNFTAAARYLIYDPYKISLSADLIKFFDNIDIAYACGVETKPFYPFSVRLGWRDYRDGFNKGITAGFGLDFDRVNISYAFSDLLGSDNDQHVFSIGIYFGKIPDSGKAYDHYTGYYLNKAKNFYEKKDYIAARKEFEDILAVYPDNVEAKKYLALLSDDLEQSDIDISGKVEKYNARGDAAMLRNNFVKAEKNYRKALDFDENNVHAQDGLKEVKAKIHEQEVYINRKKHQKEISEHWLKAMNHYDKGEFVFAKDEFLKVKEIDPDNVGADQYLAFIRKKVDKVNAVQANNIFKQGLTEYEKQNYEKALSYFNTAYIADPSRSDIKDFIDECTEQIKILKGTDEGSRNNEEVLVTNKQIEEQMKAVYEKGLEQYTLKDYDGAIVTFEELKILAEKNKYFNYNEQANNYLDKSKMAISRQIYNEAKAFESKGDLEGAYNLYKETVDYYDKNEQAKKDFERVKSILAQKYYEQALQQFSAGYTENAEPLLRKSLQYEPDKAEANRLLEKIKE